MPGATALTRMWSAAWCAAMARVMFTTAPFEVGYSSDGMAAEQPGVGGEVDDRAAAVTDHLGDGIFRHQHHRGDVDAHGVVPGLDVHVHRGAGRAADADIVHQDVEPAPGAHRLAHDALAVVRDGDVGEHDQRGAAFRLDHVWRAFDQSWF